ncbi:hypothetical protein BDZ97DRAFT_1762462 [Flammula alnicola]|nr:hypothetical protein BDZ97DRAFT_1762462 [Flammula alnicola]
MEPHRLGTTGGNCYGSYFTGWRQFTFFGAVPVKDVHDLDSTPDIFKLLRLLLGVQLIADIHGSIHLLNREFESTNSWIAHVSGRVTHMVERRGVLVTLGEEDAVRSPLLKIWDLENKDKKTGALNLLRSTKVRLSNRPHPVYVLDGTVILYRHLDQSLASSTSLTSLPEARTIHESPTEPITGLGFREPTDDDSGLGHSSHTNPNVPAVPNANTNLNGNGHYLFIVTTNRVLAYKASGRNSGGTSVVVDEIGSGLGSVHTHLNYLVIVSPTFFPTATSASATMRNLVARQPSATETDVTKVTMFDPENKLVAYSGTFEQGVREVVSQWGQVYVLSNDGNLVCLQEKSTASKLDMLYRKSLYGLGLNLAATQKLDESSVADIHRQYGGHMYAKSDWDGAMGQYVQTMGHLQPSYVIRKYLDAQRINNLVTYLQELHSLGLANADHTTLLLSTYTKLKDVARLDSFIKTESRRNAKADGGCGEFCRCIGVFEKVGAGGAAHRSMHYHRPPRPFRSCCRYIDRTGNGRSGSSYLSYLALNRGSTPATIVSSETAMPPSPSIKTVKAETASRRESVHEASVSASGPSTPPPLPIASSIVTWQPPTALVPVPVAPPVKRVSPRIYFPHFVDHMGQFVVFLETVAMRRWGQSVNDRPPGSIGLYSESIKEKEEVKVELGEDEELVDKLDQVAVWNTLLELYLTLPMRAGSTASTATTTTSFVNGQKKVEFDEKVMREKGMRVLRSDTIPYDSMHALILCSSYGFTDGLVLLWEKMGIYEDVLRFWMDKDKEGNNAGASHKVVEQLMHYGTDHPHLYPLVLRFLASMPKLLTSRCTVWYIPKQKA